MKRPIYTPVGFVTMVFAMFVALASFPASEVRADPGTGTLFGTDASGGNLISVGPTGVGTLIGPMGVGPVPALAVDHTTGVLYAGGGGGLPNLYTVSPSTGVATTPGVDTGLGFAAIGGMDFRGGTLYAAVNIAGDGGTGSDHLAILSVTGAATVIGPFGSCTGVTIPSVGGGSCTIEGIEAIAFDASGILWGARSARGAAGAPGLYTISTVTGAATFVAPILDASGAPPSGGVVSLQFACDGTLYGGTATAIFPATDGGRLITINTATGRFTFAGSVSATPLGNSLGALAIQFPCRCPEDPDAVLTRAVDPEGDDAALIGDIPTYETLQDAVDAANDGEVIGVYGRSTESVIIDGARSLIITQCTVAQITAAGAGPVVDITSTEKITIISLDTVGGTIGWRVGTDGHDLKSVRATGASQFGILVDGNRNRISYNSVRSNAVGIGIDGDFNDLRGGTVETNTGDGVQLRTTANNNTFQGASVLTNGGNGILVAGSSNTIRDNGRVNANALNGILVTGSNNSLRSNRAEANPQDGFNISGNNNTLRDNRANKNGGDGFEISGVGNILRGNASNQGASGGSNENTGAEYRLINAAINQGGNRADNIGVPKTAAPTKCQTFSAAGICE